MRRCLAREVDETLIESSHWKIKTSGPTLGLDESDFPAFLFMSGSCDRKNPGCPAIQGRGATRQGRIVRVPRPMRTSDHEF